MSLTSQQISRNTRISALIRSYELGVLNAEEAYHMIIAAWIGDKP